jgi:hypothetical protein
MHLRSGRVVGHPETGRLRDSPSRNVQAGSRYRPELDKNVTLPLVQVQKSSERMTDVTRHSI